MIDSGILSGANLAEDWSALGLKAVAHQVGLPLAVVSSVHLDQAADLAHQLDITLAPPADFETFCRTAAPHLPALVEFSRRLQTFNTGAVTQFPHPLYRLLKDHLAVRLYELSLLLSLRAEVTATPTAREFILKGCGFTMLVAKRDEGLLVVGPLFLEEGNGKGSESAYFERFSAAIAVFNQSVETFFVHHPLTHLGANATLYTQEYLRPPEALDGRRREEGPVCTARH
jgi:hypothetical protein